MARPGFLRLALELPLDQLALSHEPSGRIIASQLETAFDSRSRRQGLLGRPGMERGAALIIAPCSSVHTFFMMFPIDILFVDREGRILKLSRSVPAWRLRVALRAFATIELAAGALGEDVRIGDRLRIAPR